MTPSKKKPEKPPSCVCVLDVYYIHTILVPPPVFVITIYPRDQNSSMQAVVNFSVFREKYERFVDVFCLHSRLTSVILPQMFYYSKTTVIGKMVRYCVKSE